MTRARFLVMLVWLLAVSLSWPVVSSISVHELKLAVTSSDGTRKVSESLTYPSPLPSPITLTTDDNLKIILRIHDEVNDQNLQPHQAFLVLSNGETGNHWPFLMQVRSNGKARVEVDLRSVPEEISREPRDYSAELLIGTFGRDDALRYHLGTVAVDVPAHSSVPRPTYGPQPEIHHVFREPEKLAPLWMPIAFSGIVLLPWLLLLGMWFRLGVNLSFLTSEPTASLGPLAFLGCLVVIEALLYCFWIQLNLLQMLPWLSVLALITFITGQRALTKVQDWRLKGLR